MGFSSPLLIVFLFQASTIFRPVCGNSELKLLLDVKRALDPQNLSLLSWNESINPCDGSFLGVSCNGDGYVETISLQARGLRGSIPASISAFQQLSGLYLHFNSLNGEIPMEISNLSKLTELYLNANNLTGIIPPELGNMATLQVLHLGYNKLEGGIPPQLRNLKNLSVLSLQQNRLTGAIPAALGDLSSLMRLDLSFNKLMGTVPRKVAEISSLKFLDVRNNSLSGKLPTALKRLKEGLQMENNLALCGSDFPSLGPCNSLDANANKPESVRPGWDLPQTLEFNPLSADISHRCNKPSCPKPSKRLPAIAIFVGLIAAIAGGAIAGLIAFTWHRRRKQKIGSVLEPSDSGLSSDQMKNPSRRNASPLISLEYSNSWDRTGSLEEILQGFFFNLEEVESSTQHFSAVNLLGKNGFAATYKGILRDGSAVAVKCISKTSCRTEEMEYLQALKILTSLQHQNLVKLRGFCYSLGRGECFLIYNFADNGCLSEYLDDVHEGSAGGGRVLDWSTRVSIISGIAKGIAYLHGHQPALVHQNISAEKVLLDQQFNPLLADSGLYKLLANDAIFCSLKASAAKGCLAPEYATVGMFTEKSNVYAFGMLVLQILSGKRQGDSSIRSRVESGRSEEFMDKKLHGKFSEHQALELAKIALLCTREDAGQRPAMEIVVEELDSCSAH